MLGEFTLLSGRLVASDPGYPLEIVKNDSNFLTVVENCRNGKWQAECVVKQFDPGRLEFNAELWVRHESVKELSGLAFSDKPHAIGVDSGDAGIWDFQHFHDASVIPKNVQWSAGSGIKKTPIAPSDPWVSWCRELTANSPQNAAVLPFGVVSHAGKGDGSYSLAMWRNASGEVVALRIMFVDDSGSG